MAKYRNFWVTRADTKSVSLLCSLENMQKSIAQKALQCLCPHMNSIFSQLQLIYLLRQTDASWGLLPILCHQRWTGVKTQQSMYWEIELVQKSWFASPNLHTHLCWFRHAHIAKRAPGIGRTISANWCILLPSVHNFSLPPSVRCIRFQRRPKNANTLDLSKSWTSSLKHLCPACKVRRLWRFAFSCDFV